MIEQLDELYRDVILDHFKNSTHHGELPDAQVKTTGANPLCGDELTFYLKISNGRIEQARFNGKGCAISQAAASMLAAQLEHRTLDEAGQIVQGMKAMMQGQDPKPSVDLGDLESLAGVRKFPVRVKCAALSWNIIEQGLAGFQKSEIRTQRSDIRGQKSDSL